MLRRELEDRNRGRLRSGTTWAEVDSLRLQLMTTNYSEQIEDYIKEIDQQKDKYDNEIRGCRGKGSS